MLSFLYEPSPIDWCEEGYNGTKTEPWNTVSSLLYAASAVSLLGVGNSARYRPQKFLYICAVALTGVTSALFHAGLVYYQQKLDESFETLAVVVLLHWGMQLNGETQMRKSQNLVFTNSIIHWLAILPVVWLVKDIAVEAHLLICALWAAHQLGEASTKCKDAESGYAHKIAVASAVVGFSLWLVDFLGCDAIVHNYLVQTLGFNPQLHSVWHVLTACSLAAAGLVAIRLEETKMAASKH